MGMFDVNFTKNIKLKKGNSDIFEFIKKQILKNKDYKNNIEKDSLSIEKSHLNTLLKYNLNINIQENKKDRNTELIINGELHDTLILTILIILSIIFTYGIGIIPIIGFAYYQKIIATKQIQTLIQNYEYTI